MSSGWIVALEFGAVIVGVLGFGAWELWRLRRDRRDSSGATTRPDDTSR